MTLSSSVHKKCYIYSFAEVMFMKELYFIRRCYKGISIRTSSFLSVPDNETIKTATINPSVLRPYFNPILNHDDYFNLKKEITIKDMFNARVHYGHKIGTLKENMKWALYGERLGVCIFDLNITEKYLFKALNFLAYMSYQGAVILFISTNRTQMLPVEKLASELGQYSHTRKWQDYTFTNSRKLFGAPVRLPDVVVFFGTLTSVLERHPAIIECAKMAIPTVAIVDSNSEPNYITYPVPGNDDSMVSFEYYKNLFRKAIEAGDRVRKSNEDKYQTIENEKNMNTHNLLEQIYKRTK